MRLRDQLTAARANPGRRLLRAEDEYAHRALIEEGAPICEWAFRLHPPVFADRPAPELTRRGTTDKTATTVARVEGGKWIADCPFCPSAQVVSPLDPRFLCAGADGCANRPTKGAFATVVFPAEELRAQIEAVLLERPHRENRNWLVGETVQQLLDENAAHLDGKAAG